MSNSNYIKVGSYLYSETEQIGKGSFGKVFRGKSLASGGVVAIKVMHVESNKQAQRIKMIKAEVEALKRSKSEYIIKFYDFIVQNNTVYIVTEYCNGKDLRHYFSTHKVIEEKKAVELLKQIVNAFKDLARSQVLHRDLKPANILLHNGVCKIADFGFAKTLDFSVTDYNTQMVSIVGTPLYMSPQLLDKQKYSTKSDIWSLGIIFYEMLYGKVPWVGKDPASYSKNIRSIPLSFDLTVNPISAEAQDFLIHCLKVSEEDRIGWNELFEHSLVCDDDQLSKSTREDSTYAEDIRVIMPNKMISDYVKMPIKPSSLVKQYQGKALERSRDMTNFNMELTKTTIDQKIKNINQLALSQSLVPGKTPISKVITNSFNEDPKNIETLLNTNHLKSNVLKDSKELSISPVSARKLSPKMSDEKYEEFKKIETPLIVMKTKLIVLNDLYKIVYKNEDFKELQILKFSFLIAIAKLINLIFKVLSQQVLTKKVKTRSHLLQDYLESDNFLSLVVFVETNKKRYDEMLKNCSRKLFELNLSSDKEKDEVLEFYHEIYNEVEEQTLLGKMVDMANQMLYQIRFNSQIYSKKSTSPKHKNSTDVEISKEYLEGVLAMFGDDIMLDNFKYDKMEDVMAKMERLRKEANNRTYKR